MAEYLSNRDGGKTDEHGLLRALSKVVGNDVIEGASVVENSTPNMNVLVKPGDVTIDSGSGYRYAGWLDADKSLTITTANATNPRKDLIVAYIDKSVVQSTTSNNINALKLAVVTGTPAGSPVEPNASAIQTAVGAGNPYEILALVDVPANDTVITSDQITDRRGRVPTLERIRQYIDTETDFVQEGCNIAIVSGLNVSLSAGVVWIDGLPVDVSLISSVALTASRDNYVDIDKKGTVYITPVTNNTASPVLASNRIRIGIVVTGASTVSVINQGNPLATAPTVSNEILNVSDSLGNLICPQRGQKLLAHRRRTTLFSTTSATPVVITGLTATVKIPSNVRRIKVKALSRAIFNSTNGVYVGFSVWQGVVGSGTFLYRQFNGGGAASASHHVPANIEIPLEVTPGSTITLGVGLDALTGGTSNATVESVAGQGDTTLSVEVA